MALESHFPRVIVVGVALAAGGCGGSPGPGQRIGEDARAMAATVADLRSESEALEAEFDDIVTELDVPDADQIALLEEAVLARREVVALLGQPDPEELEALDRLEGKVSNARARLFRAESMRLEERASRQYASGDLPGAASSLSEAIRLLREIEAEAREEDADLVRRIQALETRVIEIEAEPLAAERDRQEAEGRQSAADGRIAEARISLERARQIQEQINRDFGMSGAASQSRLLELENLLTNLEVIPLVHRRDAALAAAVGLETAGEHARAAQEYARARDLQREINLRFSGSSFASETLADRYEEARLRALRMPAR